MYDVRWGIAAQQSVSLRVRYRYPWRRAMAWLGHRIQNVRTPKRTNMTKKDINQVDHTLSRSTRAGPPFFVQYGSSLSRHCVQAKTCTPLSRPILETPSDSSNLFCAQFCGPSDLPFCYSHCQSTNDLLPPLSRNLSSSSVFLFLLPFILQCIFLPTFVSSHSSSERKPKMQSEACLRWTPSRGIAPRAFPFALTSRSSTI